MVGIGIGIWIGLRLGEVRQVVIICAEGGLQVRLGWLRSGLGLYRKEGRWRMVGR